MALIEAFLERNTIDGIVAEIFVFSLPVWIAFLLGVMVGWAWKPRWASFGNCKFDISPPSSPSALIASTGKDYNCINNLGYTINGDGAPGIRSCDARITSEEQVSLPSAENTSCRSSELNKEESSIITDKDLEHLCHLVERKDGGPPWKHMMDRSTNSMNYQAWQRDVENGPPQYCSRTVYEDAAPELLRDFFWDDEFRLKWDDMLVHAAPVEECPTTGTMVVHWTRKFPFFCSDREYTTGRRIWDSGRSYYCVTKSVPCPCVPRKDKPRRVDVYYSSWYIQAVESRKGNGQLTACEVLLFHHEEIGIPWGIAKFGIRQGMWGAVNKIERGFRAYHNQRKSGAPLSHFAFMAQINTKIDPEHLKCLRPDDPDPPKGTKTKLPELAGEPKGFDIPKLLIFSGAVLVACSLDHGFLTKGLILSVGRRFANLARQATPRTL